MRENEGKQVKKIAIVGCSDSKDLAPFTDAEWEIWGVNNLFHHITKYDKWFEIHNLTKDSDGNWQRRGQVNFRGQNINDYVNDLAKIKCPIYMQQHWDNIPTSIPYPLEECKKRFGSIMGWFNNEAPEGLTDEQLNRKLYGTNTVTYMILLAIMEGATHIGVYGVDMAVDTEYHYQRPSCEFALGIAFGLGIKIYIPPQADLLKTVHLYGFEERLNDEWHEKLKKMDESMLNRQNKSTGEMDVAKSIIDRSDGANRIIAFMRETLKVNPSIEDITTALLNAENDVKIQTAQAKAQFDKGYSAQQQYIGARQASKEIIKIWGTIR
jgi:hypothetical protein